MKTIENEVESLPPETQTVELPPASKSISLPSGGQVTLSFNGNFFQLSKADREFVYGLLDAMTTYNGQRSVT